MTRDEQAWCMFAAAAMTGYSANARVMDMAIDDKVRPTCPAKWFARMAGECADACLKELRARFPAQAFDPLNEPVNPITMPPTKYE